ncbi:hypothetical protein KKF04_06115 [Patescibacteria group bacterium]|nr:hypothetical protein [Patescibacteria group bacterium]
MILKAIAKLIGKPNTVSSTDSENIKYFQDAEKGDIFYAKYNSHIFVYRGNKWEFVDEWLDRDASRYFSEILFKRSKSDIVKENDLKKNKIPLLNKKWANEQINKLLPTGKNNLIIEFNKNENNYFQYLNETTVFFVKYGKFLF